MVYSIIGAVVWCRMSHRMGVRSWRGWHIFLHCDSEDAQHPFPHVESFTFSRKLNLRVPMLIKPPTAVEAYLFALLLPPLHLMSE